MPVTSFSPIDIGAGIANGISQGGSALAQAIDKVGENYANDVALLGTAQMLNKMKDQNGNPIMSNDELNTYLGQSVGAKSRIMGMYMAKYMAGMDIQKAQALQKSQGEVDTTVHAANTATDYNIATQYGVVPGVSPGQRPAPVVNPPQNGTPNPQGQPQSSIISPGSVSGSSVPTLNTPGNAYHGMPARQVNDQYQVQNPRTGTWYVYDPSSGKLVGKAQ